MAQDKYARSVEGREIGRWDLKDIEKDDCMREALRMVRNQVAIQVGGVDPVNFLVDKLVKKFPPNSRNPRLDFTSGVIDALQRGLLVFDEEYGVLQMSKASEPEFDKIDIITSSDGSSRVRHWEENQPPPTLYSWYLGNLL